MQTIQEPDVLQQPFCASGDKNTIPSEATGSQLASLAEGFPLVTQQPTTQGGIPPERKDFNGAFNLLSKYNYAIQNGWLPTFKQEVSQAIGGYAEGACLWYMPTEGTYVGQVLMLKSLVANNTYDFTANPDSYIGTYWQVVTSAGGGAAFPLLSFISSDHVLNNTSWLRADTFSWQSGNVYSSVYQHLVDDISGITAETETISGTTITFYRATDGHKIVLSDQESNVSAIYTATGVAWYYILDTTNQRFKLPRTKFNVVGLRDTVGNYVSESLPNITGTFGRCVGTDAATGAFERTGSTTANVGDTGSYNTWMTFDASRSSSTYQDNAPVQQRATQAYLYFYVGNTVQDQTTIDVGEITDALNGKADINLSNVSTTSGFRKLVEVYNNGASWYKVFDEYDPVTGAFIGKWCEQGGSVAEDTGDVTQTITFLKTFSSTPNVQVTPIAIVDITMGSKSYGVTSLSTSNFTIRANSTYWSTLMWRAEGFVSQGA